MAIRKKRSLTYKQNLVLGIAAGLTGSALIFGSIGLLAAVVQMRADRSEEETILHDIKDVKEMVWQIGRVRRHGRPLEDCLVRDLKALCLIYVEGERRFLVIEEANRP